ncbi:MAG: afsK [Chitinophagaceae bacterium]|nr:afsK [Chitinophagaceae bacterium]
MKKIIAILIVIFSAAILSAQNKASSQWAMFHQAAEQDIHSAAKQYKALGNVKWKFKTNGKIFSSPAIVNDIGYIGSGDGCLYAIDTKSGKQHWKFKTGGPVHSSPAVYKDVVYFGSFDGYYYAIDAVTGKQKWKFRTGGEKWMGGLSYWGMKPEGIYMDDFWDYFLSSPIVDRQDERLTMYFGSSDGYLYAVNAGDGTLKWKFAANGIIHTSPVLNNGVIYFGAWDTYFYAVDAKTGKEKWKFKTGGNMAMSGIEASAVVENGLVYFGARDGYMYALNADKGSIAWKYDAENSWILSTPVISDDVLYVGTSDSYLLLALEAQTGVEKWRYKTNGYVFSSPTIAGGMIYFGDFTGKMNALDLASAGKKASEFSTESRKQHAATVLKNDTLNFMYTAKDADLSLYPANKKVMDEFYKLGPIVSSPAIKNGVLYFGSADGCFYALNLTE